MVPSKSCQDDKTSYGVSVVKIIKQTPSLLEFRVDEIEDRITLLFILAFLVLGIVANLVYNQNKPYVLSTGLFVPIVFLKLLSPLKTCLFDKTEGKFSLKPQGLFATKIVKYDLSEIRSVNFNESYMDTVMFQVSIVLVSNKHIYLTSNSSSGRNSKQRMASCIRNFLYL